jgi:hypothetical protein
MTDITLLDSLKKLPLNTPSLNVLYASSNVGKTFFLKELLYFLACERREFDKVYCFSPTGNLSTSAWTDILDPPFLQYEVDVSKISRLLEFNKKQLERGQDRRICIILDDVLPTDLSEGVWTSISTRLRHYGATVFFTCQYAFKLPPCMRGNAHNIFIFKQTSEKSFKVLYEEVLCNFFSKRSDCSNFIKKHTKDYSVIVLDNVNSKLYNVKARNRPYNYHINQ